MFGGFMLRMGKIFWARADVWRLLFCKVTTKKVAIKLKANCCSSGGLIYACITLPIRFLRSGDRRNRRLTVSKTVLYGADRIDRIWGRFWGDRTHWPYESDRIDRRLCVIQALGLRRDWVATKYFISYKIQTLKNVSRDIGLSFYGCGSAGVNTRCTGWSYSSHGVEDKAWLHGCGMMNSLVINVNLSNGTAALPTVGDFHVAEI